MVDIKVGRVSDTLIELVSSGICLKEDLHYMFCHVFCLLFGLVFSF